MISGSLAEVGILIETDAIAFALNNVGSGVVMEDK